MTQPLDNKALLKLLEPFSEEEIGKLPRVTCRDCSDYRTTCQKHTKQRCNTCQAYVSEQHIHLDYVGHADVTRRLLEVDPAWQWEPVAEDENGLPLLDTDDKGNPVGLWIKLTVLGVTRRGYGSCPSNQTDAVKVLIGDALRNAAMRFGVALGLWAKGDRANPAAENAVASAGTPSRRRRDEPVHQQTDHEWLEGIEQRIHQALNLAELKTLAEEINDKVRAGGCEQIHQAHLWTLGKAREKELSARPQNKDGSTSRSRATDEQLEAIGAMTREQLRDHNKMVREVQATPKKADRATGPDPDDPWTNTSESSGERGKDVTA
ncbi:hypothetical protein ACFY4C_20345 [Actinomadura viridis]|uniref:hypothetical protein n=1 Tax=Actinomadura viridis TaxID=58110 RepID=UPI0036B32261